jgi:hypothetical protein
LKCVLCGQRKGRRQCPARGALICPHCCGSKRRVEIACPEGCVYLDGTHAGAWQGRVTEKERDGRRVLPHVEMLSDTQQGLFINALLSLRDLARAAPALDDRLVATALLAFRKTVETRTHGLIYAHPPEDARAQALIENLGAALKLQDESGRALEPPDSDLLAVLRALEAILSAEPADPSRPRAFLDLAARLTAEVGAETGPAPEPRILLS